MNERCKKGKKLNFNLKNNRKNVQKNYKNQYFNLKNCNSRST